MKTDLMKHGGGWTLAFWCSGCQTHHAVNVRLATDLGDRGWVWDGDRERPTLTPSIRVCGTVPLTEDQIMAHRAGGVALPVPVPLECHLYLTNGVIHYLGDCSHDKAGTQVPLEDLP